MGVLCVCSDDKPRLSYVDVPTDWWIFSQHDLWRLESYIQITHKWGDGPELRPVLWNNQLFNPMIFPTASLSREIWQRSRCSGSEWNGPPDPSETQEKRKSEISRLNCDIPLKMLPFQCRDIRVYGETVMKPEHKSNTVQNYNATYELHWELHQ